MPSRQRRLRDRVRQDQLICTPDQHRALDLGGDPGVGAGAVDQPGLPDRSVLASGALPNTTDGAGSRWRGDRCVASDPREVSASVFTVISVWRRLAAFSAIRWKRGVRWRLPGGIVRSIVAMVRMLSCRVGPVAENVTPGPNSMPGANRIASSSHVTSSAASIGSPLRSSTVTASSGRTSSRPWPSTYVSRPITGTTCSPHPAPAGTCRATRPGTSRSAHGRGPP